jgi:hypothetical protein
MFSPFSPDGEWIAYLSTDDRGFQFRKMPVAGGSPVVVTT